MKFLKITLLTMIMLLGVNKINAQIEVIGFWKTELPDERGDTEMVIINFNKNGKLIISSKNFGTWSYNNTEKTITIKSELKSINGINKVEKLDDNQMVLINAKSKKKFFERISLPNGQEYNNEITGTYILKKVYENGKLDNERQNIVVFKNNGILFGGNYDIVGSWEYNNKEKELILLNSREGVDGKYKIENQEKELIITGDSFKLVFDRLNIEEIHKKMKF